MSTISTTDINYSVYLWISLIRIMDIHELITDIINSAHLMIFITEIMDINNSNK